MAVQKPFQPSMTADTAIRIDLHSTEVVPYTHTIRIPYPDLYGSPHIKMHVGVENPTITFHMTSLAWSLP